MSFDSGGRLGPYEIVVPLGAGGMGEVYRAHDVRLGRDVAIKVLPQAFLADPERLQRFEQEARATAALNHPNILAVYDIGQHDAAPYIVSELLEGEALRTRLDAGPLPVRRAVDYAIQIARGLTAAHEKGIAHRDLKPENVFVTADNRIKILDFGLAKVVQPRPTSVGVSGLPTSPPDTQAGMVLGTVGYMAPEQVRGLPADHRSDIFALGAVLYEMLSGRRAFRGDTTADTMTAILKEDPPAIATASEQIAPGLMRVVDRCLEKNPAARFQSASDLAFALEGLSSASGSREMPEPAARRRRGSAVVGWSTAVLALVAFVATLPFAVAHLREAPPDAPVVRFGVPPPDDTVFAGGSGFSPGQAVSPDGRFVVFLARRVNTGSMLWLRSLDRLEVRPLDGTEDGQFPFWSPDSRSIGFFATGKLKKFDTSNGSTQTICDAPAGEGGTWNRDGIVVFVGSAVGGLSRVPAIGGQPAALTELETGDTSHRWPQFLPDGRRFLYLVEPGDHVRVGSIDSPETTALLDADSKVLYAPPGYVLFVREATLMAQRFDAARLTLVGDAVPVAEEVAFGEGNGRASFSVSDNGGVLAYRINQSRNQRQLALFDRSGTLLQSIGSVGDYRSVALSPDGTRAIVHEHEDPKGGGLWLIDLIRGGRPRFGSSDAHEARAVWSPDGSHIAFDSADAQSTFDLYQNVASGIGQSELLRKSKDFSTPTSWSANVIVFTTASPTADIWALPLSGDLRPMSPLPIVQTQFGEFDGVLSSDGRLLAYVSNETGRDEIYVKQYPSGDRWPISTTGGIQPRWRGDGNELFYLTSGAGGVDGSDIGSGLSAGSTAVMAVEIRRSGSMLERSTPKTLFEKTLLYRFGLRARGVVTDLNHTYDVSFDGKRFLILQQQKPAGQIKEAPLTIVLNWTAGLFK